MSFFTPLHPNCPQCGTPLGVNLVLSLNADRRPDLREALLDGTFQRFQCAECLSTVRPEPEFIYIDVGRGQWLATEPVENLGRWNALEEKAHSTWEKAFGAKAGPAARAIGARLQPRVAFGWPAVVEKLLCFEHGIDDVQLELLKLALVRSGGYTPMSDTVELRLGRVSKDTLVLGWIEASTEKPLEIIEVERSVLEDFGDEAWEPLRSRLSEGLYVDMNRLLSEPAPGAAHA